MANLGPATTVTASTVATLTPVNTLTNPGPQGLNSLRLLASGRGVNVNATGDVAVLPIINAASWVAATVVLTNASVSLTTALAGIFTAAAAGGTAIKSNAALSGLTAATVVSAAAAANVTTAFTVQNIYVNVGTAQGAAATLDVFVYGYDLT